MTSIEALLRAAFTIKDELGEAAAEEAIRAARAAMARAVFRRAVARLSEKDGRDSSVLRFPNGMFRQPRED